MEIPGGSVCSGLNRIGRMFWKHKIGQLHHEKLEPLEVHNILTITRLLMSY